MKTRRSECSTTHPVMITLYYFCTCNRDASI